MLSQAINIGKYIGMDENAPMERVQLRLKGKASTFSFL